LSDLNETCSDRFSKNTQIPDFTKICRVFVSFGRRVTQTVGRTDRHDGANILFEILGTRLKRQLAMLIFFVKPSKQQTFKNTFRTL